MPRTTQTKQQKTQSPPQQQELLERLLQTVERLEGELRCIRETLDRIQDDFAWALDNDPARQNSWRPAPPPMHITSLPRDPLVIGDN